MKPMASMLKLLMVHAQDQIMNAINFKDLAQEIIDLYRKLADKWSVRLIEQVKNYQFLSMKWTPKVVV